MNTAIEIAVYGQVGALGVGLAVLFAMATRDLWDMARGRA